MNKHSELNEPIFLINKMAKASQVEPGTIRVWFQRGHIQLGLKDKEAKGNGFARLFSARTVLMIAIMGALTKLGIDPRTAAKAATKFCHTGDCISEIGEILEDASTKTLPARQPGFLCSAFETLLVVTSGPERSSYIVPLSEDTKFREVFIRPSLLSHGATHIPLRDLVNSTRSRLGLSQDIS